ncbi:uncharacterized protein LOC126810238 isoform X1 [Patella vulgata]|uniref:uncharacterized protein LOC126810238 isoform X1 n=1 Tax=Patella vulgata TaxID=6465 RepID=UPI00218054C6|nr:uncharacterized protein LOC126810238 isoform X1 [Patella vulgata]
MGMLLMIVTVITVFIITSDAFKVLEECHNIGTNITCPNGYRVNITNGFYGLKSTNCQVLEPKCCSFQEKSNDRLAEYSNSDFKTIYNQCMYHQSCFVNLTSTDNRNNTCCKNYSRFGRIEYECEPVNILDLSNQTNQMRTGVPNVSLVYDDESSSSTTYSRDRTCLIQSEGEIRVSVVDILLKSLQPRHSLNFSKTSTPSYSICNKRLSIIDGEKQPRLCMGNGNKTETYLGKYQGPVAVLFRDNQPGDKMIIDLSAEGKLNITCNVVIFSGGNPAVDMIDTSVLYIIIVSVIVLVLLVMVGIVLVCCWFRRRKQRRKKCSEQVTATNSTNAYEYIDTELPDGVRKGYLLLPKKDKSLTLRFVKTVAMDNCPAGSEGSYCHIVKHHEPFHDQSPILSGYKHICQIQTQQSDHDSKLDKDVYCDQQAEPLEEDTPGSFDIKKDISTTLQLRPGENSELLREIANEFGNELSAISDGLSEPKPSDVDNDFDHYEQLGQTKFVNRPAISTDEKDTYNRLDIHNLNKSKSRQLCDNYDHLGAFKEDISDQNVHYNRLQF